MDTLSPKKLLLYCYIALSLFIALESCAPVENDPVNLSFYLRINRDIYLDTIYGEPPQIAIWMKNPKNGKIYNLWVSRRTGENDWVGKVYCKVSLPYWQSSQQGEQINEKSLPSQDKVEGITAATPKSDFIETKVCVPFGSQWIYYLEVNVSGDFNESFPNQHPDGYPDTAGNGQPSLIYKGSITAKNGNSDVPELVGRTKQWQPVDYILDDLKGITTAAELLNEVKVTCERSTK
mgnify:CR=1 FL=1